MHLAYELYLTNATARDVNVESVIVKAGAKALLSLSGDEPTRKSRILAVSGGPTNEFGPAQSGLVWFDVALDGSTPQVPQELSHSVSVSLTQPMPPLLPAHLAEDIAKVTVSTHQHAVIAPPLDARTGRPPTAVAPT